MHGKIPKVNILKDGGCVTFAQLFSLFAFAFIRTILRKFLAFTIRLHRKLTSVRVLQYLLFSVQLQDFTRCICCGLEEIYSKKIFCEKCKPVRRRMQNIFYNSINNRIPKFLGK